MKTTAGKLVVFATLLLLGVRSFAQSTPTHYCPSDDLTDSLIANDPRWARSFFYMEQMIQAQQNLPAEERSNDIYNLPVVVHVIHLGEAYGTATNISDEQVQSAITALNEDFRRMSGSNGFGAGVDVGLEFCLAARDPNGNPTTGIVRVNGTSVTNYATQGINASSSSGADESAVKALSTWPRASYINIWVVSEIDNNDGGAGIQGYAYFPFNNPRDGITILFNAFGTVGTLKSYTNMNRTLTHEVGHYFGLYHTFNDTNSCSSESNCVTQGDRVCDTPTTILNSSCSAPACSGTQQIANYMDYTSQTCQDMFTEGQKTRMRTTLETQRTSMLSSLGCAPVFARDAGITAIASPNGSSCNTTYNPSVTLTNFGSQTLTSISILYNVDGVGSNTFSWTGSLTSGTSASVTLPSISTALGTHIFYSWTNNPNGQSDQNAANNQLTSNFEVAVGATVTLVVTLDYFGLENTWIVTNSSGTQVASGGPYVNNQQGAQFTTSLCLPNGCYTLTFFDQYGDGQGFISGNFTLYDEDDNQLVYQTGNWGAQSNNPFCVTAAPPSGNPPVASFTIPDAVVCTGQQVSFVNTSTNTPTSYAWTFTGGAPSTSTSANPSNITWATANTYSVSLTAANANGSNTYTCTNCITVIAAPTVTLTTTNPLCASGATGQITTAVSGGYSPYSYIWNTGATSANLSNVAAGSYNVTVTNSQGCTRNVTASLTAPSAISISGTPTPPSCAGQNTGSITVNATGGTGTKTYFWSNGANTATVSNLAAGTYSVTATDANNCTASQSFTLTAPSAIVIAGTTSNPSCGQNNGNISVNASGGTGSKTYLWNTGAITAAINSLTAGLYTVTATDANNCSVSQSFTLNSSSSIQVVASTTAVSCFGGNNGTASTSVTGASGTITYTWSNGMTGAAIQNLAAGTYFVTVLDQNGCSASTSVTVSQPAALTMSVSAVNISCGVGTGSASATASGGTAPYSFAWSNSATGNSSGTLSAGNYSVTVTDQNGCSVSQNFSITSSSGLSVSIQTSAITCHNQNDGSITAQVSGGTGPFSYSWNNGGSTANILSLAGGSYTVTVTDSQGCSGSATAVLVNPTTLNAIVFKSDISCHGANDGAAVMSVNGGTGTYFIEWSNGSEGVTVGGLESGLYTVIVSDENGCTVSESFTIAEPAVINLTTEVITPESCAGGDGSAVANAMGGTGLLSFTWTNGANGQQVSGLSAGEYGVQVSDSNGCTAELTVTIDYDCEVVLPTTRLINSDCGATNVLLSDVIECEEISSALAYQWRFGNLSGQTIAEPQTTTTELALSAVNGIAVGQTYVVHVRSRVGDTWSAYGEECTISTENLPLVTQLVEEDCGTTITAWGQTVYADPIPGALNYEWNITGPGYEWTSFTLTNSFDIGETMLFVPGDTYDVRVRCGLGNGVYTEWGMVCPLTFAPALSIENEEEIVLEGGLLFYPNPNDGQTIFFDSGNLIPGTAVKDLTLFNMAGQLVEEISISIAAQQKALINYTFTHPLAPGMYLVYYTINGKPVKEKLIVR